MLRTHIKHCEQRLQRAACATLKRSLSMSCVPLLKQLIRVRVNFKCFLPVLFDRFIAP